MMVHLLEIAIQILSLAGIESENVNPTGRENVKGTIINVIGAQAQASAVIVVMTTDIQGHLKITAETMKVETTIEVVTVKGQGQTETGQGHVTEIGDTEIETGTEMIKNPKGKLKMSLMIQIITKHHRHHPNIRNLKDQNVIKMMNLTNRQTMGSEDSYAVFTSHLFSKHYM